MTQPWTLGQIKEQGHFLYAGCSEQRSIVVLLDVDELIGRYGADFDILGTQLENKLQCPCGLITHHPKVGVGETAHLATHVRKEADRAMGSAGYGSMATPFEEAVQHQLQLRAEWRRSDPRTIAEEERLTADLAKVRERKARRRARNPYDFS